MYLNAIAAMEIYICRMKGTTGSNVIRLWGRGVSVRRRRND